MTSLPAQKFQLHDRGFLQVGYAADVLVFDENEVLDLSTFDKPHAYSVGMHYVIVNGKITVDNQKHIGTRAGQILYGPGKLKL
jgi:N-acyl-D-amino-acid deacylase